MRVTLNMLARQTLSNLSASAERLVEAEDRASSGKRIHRPSDDVTGAGRAIRMRSALNTIEQFTRNVQVAKAQLTFANNALDSAVSVLQDTRTLALSAASSTVTQEARSAIAAALDRAMVELVGLGNTRQSEQYIFSGSQTGLPPLVPDGSGSAPYIYQGDSAQFTIQISPGTYVTANVTADRIFNMGGAAVPGASDVFSMIKSLRDEVLAGDVAAISARVEDIDANLNNVVAIRSEIGARLKRLESVNDALMNSKVAFSDLLSKTEDVDLTEAVLQLRTRENAYQAAIATASRVMNISLADYLD